MALRQPVYCHIHRVARHQRAGEQGGVQQGFAAIVQRLLRGGVPVVALAHQRHQGHAVLGERAGFVGAEHGGGTQSFNARGAARQYPRLGYAPGAHGHKYRHHQWELLRQQRHTNRNAA